MRGLPGWGANMGTFMTFMNTYGGRWYNENWEPQLTTPEFKDAIERTRTWERIRQPGITSDNFPECR